MNDKRRKYSSTSKNKHQKSQTKVQNNSIKSELSKNWGYDPVLRYSKASTNSKPTIIVRELQVGVDPKTNEPLKVLAAEDPSTGARLVYGHPSMSSFTNQQENKGSSVQTVQAVTVIIDPDSHRLEVQEVPPQTNGSFSNYLNKTQSYNKVQDISGLPPSEAENICKYIVIDAVTEATSSRRNSKSRYSSQKSQQIGQYSLGDTRYSKGRISKDVQLSQAQEDEEICRGIFEEAIRVATEGGDKDWDADESPIQSDENLPPVDPKNECEDCNYWPPRKKRKKPSQVGKRKKQCVPWGKCQQEQEPQGEDKPQKPEWQFFLTTFFKFRGKEPLREVLKKKNVNGTQDMDSILSTEPFQLAHTAIKLKKMEIPKIINPETRSGNHNGIQENESRVRLSADRCQSNTEQEKEAYSRHDSTARVDSSGRSERSLVRSVARKYKGFMKAVLKRKRK